MMAWLERKRRVNPATGKMETYWAASWRVRGRITTRAIGFLPESEAKRALKILEGKLAAGDAAVLRSSGLSSSVTRKTSPKLGDYLFDVYLPVAEREKAPSTAANERYCCEALKGLMGHLRLDQIDYAVVDAYLSERAREGRMPRTRYLELRTLRYALKHAHDCNVLGVVPQLPKVKVNDKKPHRFLSEEETVALLDAARPLDHQPHKVTRGRPPECRDPLSYLAILMAVNTGMRKGEILSRSWEDVQWDTGLHGAILIGPKPEIGFEVKMRRSRVVPLTPELLAELERAHRDAGSPETGWLFPSPVDSSIPRKSFTTAIEGACRRAKLQRISQHDLRRTWASRLAMAGVDRRTLMEVGGWKESRVLDEIYSHVTDDHVAEVMSRMGVTGTQGSTPPEAPDRDGMLDRTAGQLRVLDGGGGG